MVLKDLGAPIDELSLGNNNLATDDVSSSTAALDDSQRRHYLKKLLLSRLVEEEIASLNDPRSLENFGQPFRQASDAVLIDATNTDLPIIRFVFTKFVCTFPFLAKTDQDVFWQDKVQSFMQAFANKRISSSEDRAESSKRAKLASRLKSMLVLLLNAGVHAGKEESITIDEAERRTAEGAQNLEVNLADGQMINGLDVNVAGVRTMQKPHKVRRREHHSEFLVRSKRQSGPEVIVARRYGAFKKLHSNLREEFPGKQIPRLPMKNKAPATAASYIPSMPTFGFGSSRQSMDEDSGESADEENSRIRIDQTALEGVRIPREKQRLTLRSFLRRLLKDQQIAQSTALRHFLFDVPIKLTVDEEQDCQNRRSLDALRHDEQIKFLEVARDRARDLDAQMDIFKKQLIQDNGLSKIFGAIREHDCVEDLPQQYIKVIEWGRIEVAATLYQLFVADDNSSEMFAQAKRVHSLFPYTVLKNIIRFSNPMTMMRAGIDLFLATPFGRASLFQRMFSSTLTEEIKDIGVSIEALRVKVADNGLCDKIRAFVHAREDQQAVIRLLAQEDDVDLLVALMRNNELEVGPKLNAQQVTKVFLANVAWRKAIEGTGEYNVKDAQLYGFFSQLLKLYTRQRDKEQMMELLFDGATSNLLKDIVGIFYEPLARVYKAASIHNSIIDFSRFVNDMIETVEKAEEQDLSTNPNALVQTFIDLTGRHQNSFFHFVHEAHAHDDGLFEGLMSWVELILTFLREGAPQQLDLAEIFQSCPDLDRRMALSEVDACIAWNVEMKLWRQERLRKKMAAAGPDGNSTTATNAITANSTASVGTALSGGDFGLDQTDLEEIMYDADSLSEDGDGSDCDSRDEAMDALDPLEAEMRRKKRDLARLQRRYGEPEMPAVTEVYKMTKPFKDHLRIILART